MGYGVIGENECLLLVMSECGTDRIFVQSRSESDAVVDVFLIFIHCLILKKPTENTDKYCKTLEFRPRRS